jgi:fructose-bisphosphate aldolase class 1
LVLDQQPTRRFPLLFQTSGSRTALFRTAGNICDWQERALLLLRLLLLRLLLAVLKIVFEQLHMYNVLLEGIILKPNMIISAIDCPVQADVEKVADLTYACLKENVPGDVPGIAFLSGGQSSDLATLHLNKMNEKYSDMPWNLTFSYGRALQHDSLNTWEGKKENRKRNKKKF